MNQPLTCLALGLACVLGMPAHAQNATYDASKRHLTLPSIQIGGTVYRNVVLRIDGVGVVSVGSAGGAGCTLDNLTAAKFEAIARGATLNEVSAVVGCSPVKDNTGLYDYYVYGVCHGSSYEYFSVAIDPATGKTPTAPGSIYKNKAFMSAAASGKC